MYKTLLPIGKCLSQLFDDEDQQPTFSTDVSPQTPIKSSSIDDTKDEISEISTNTLPSTIDEEKMEIFAANSRISKEIAKLNRQNRAAKRRLQRQKNAKILEKDWKITLFYQNFEDYKTRNDLYKQLQIRKPNLVQLYQLFRGFIVYDWSVIGNKVFDPAFQYWSIYRDDHDESYHYNRPSEAIIWRNKFYLYEWMQKVPYDLRPLFQDDFDEQFFKRYSLKLTNYNL